MIEELIDAWRGVTREKLQYNVPVTGPPVMRLL